MKFPALNFAQVVTHPVARRRHKVATDMVGAPWQAGGAFAAFLRTLPHTLAAADLSAVVTAVVAAVRAQRPVVLGMGAHPLKVGLSPLIIDLLRRGILSAVAMNGAGVIHDFELAAFGATSEDVAATLGDGSFGMARETGEFLNAAIAQGVLQDGDGLGKAVGKRIAAAGFPHVHFSVLAACARLDVPVCVHVAIGTDVVHMHPQVNGAALGEGSLRDFRLLTRVVAQLEGGVFINLGSAVILPEVFLKAVALARNLGNTVNAFTTVDMDFMRHYRPAVNVVARPTQGGGHGFHLTGHHEIMFPLVCAAVIEALEASP